MVIFANTIIIGFFIVVVTSPVTVISSMVYYRYDRSINVTVVDPLPIKPL